MAKNEDWHALDEKAVGDTITLLLRGAGYSSDFPERLAEGTLTKITKATRTFTMPGAARDGDIQLRAGMRWARTNPGFIRIDEVSVNFFVATQTDIARMTDPNRERREALDDALRSLRHSRVTKRDDLDVLLVDLAAATAAAAELRDALASDPR